MNASAQILTAEALQKHFGGVHARGGVELEAVPREFRAIIGPSGAGKSTLFRTLTGLLQADPSSVRSSESNGVKYVGLDELAVGQAVIDDRARPTLAAAARRPGTCQRVSLVLDDLNEFRIRAADRNMQSDFRHAVSRRQGAAPSVESTPTRSMRKSSSGMSSNRARRTSAATRPRKPRALQCAYQSVDPAQRYRAQVEALLAFLDEEEHRAEAMEAVRGLIDEVVLTPENGELRIDLKGELAAILRLCRDGATTKPAALGDGLDAQVKLVAGARNQRYLQGLVGVRA